MHGLTWDHPRGVNPLVTGAEYSGLDITWDWQSLEGFEAAPIDSLFSQYDVVVMDHPHLGDALAAECVMPVEEWLPSDRVGVVEKSAYVGPSIASYTMHGRLWALPVDAAAQVAVCNAARVADLPSSWEEVIQCTESLNVCLCLAGPHALLTFASICRSLEADADSLIPSKSAMQSAYEILVHVARRMNRDWSRWNPIDVLEHMSAGDGGDYCPLVFGYVNYSRRPRPGAARLSFVDAPTGNDGRIGSVIGGTGLAVSSSAKLTADEIAYLVDLVSVDSQCGRWVASDGQPARVEAWTNSAVDREAHGFYSQTLASLRQSHVRPRVPNFTHFQGEASAVVRAAIFEHRPFTWLRTELARLAEKFSINPEEGR